MARPRKGSAQDRLAANWKTVWHTPAGRLAISELLIATNVYSEIQTTDPLQMAMAIGERNVAARIARYLGLKAEDYVQDATDAVDLVSKFMESHQL